MYRFLFLWLLLAACTTVPQPTCDAGEAPAFYTIDEDLGYVIYHDLKTAQACSRTSGKPILLMFTCWACMGNRAGAESLYTHQKVRTLINENYILLWLYVDDKRLLPHPSGTQLNGQPITTIGHQNLTLEMTRFDNNSQPLYVLVDADLNALSAPLGYLPKKEHYRFVDLLEQGLKE